jgi:hypothetical protein
MKRPPAPGKEIRGNPRLVERVHDPYRITRKLDDPTRCVMCGAVFSQGRWQWLHPAPTAAAEALCPACRRIKDRYPAGELLLEGDFIAAHADEVLGLIRNTEEAERREHPLNRIIDIERRGNAISITTTDLHLPQRIGHALEDAYDGTLSIHYDEQGYFTRVHWQRQA